VAAGRPGEGGEVTNLAADIMVCDVCGSAACWNGNLMCEESYGAGTVTVTQACMAGGTHRCRALDCGCPHHNPGGDRW
ncbi:MAG TPA: hypothetical protein VF180_13340, partial [Acidimicrobiia bacterium]